jgi:RDD family
MKRAGSLVFVLTGCLLVTGVLNAHAQTPAPNVQVEAPRQTVNHVRWSAIAMRIGQDYTLRSGELAREVVVISGSATIAGHVRNDVIVAFGTLRLTSTAMIDGSLVVIGGNATVEPGAAVRQNLLVVGGMVEGPPDFSPGGDHFVIGAAPLFERAKAVLPWVTEGLLMGRPIVPRLNWVWMVVGIVFLVSLALNLIFLDAVRLCASSLAARPLSTFLVGLLVLLLVGPLAIVLAASVIGLAVVPFLFCAVAIAWLLGKVGVSLWVGGSIIGVKVPETRPQALVAFIVGFAVITFAYMVPVLGFIVYGLVGVIGLGAASLAFATAYRRENPAPSKAVRATPAGSSAAVAAPFDGLPEGAPLPGDPVPSAEEPSDASVKPLPSTNLVFFPRATFLDRLAAFALDCALVLITNNALNLTDSDGGPIFLLLAYHIVFWTWKGTTIGGIICQLRVVRTDGEPLRFIDSLVRGLSSMFSIAALGLGCFWILRDPERQAWHDKIASTYVVKVPRSYPLP